MKNIGIGFIVLSSLLLLSSSLLTTINKSDEIEKLKNSSSDVTDNANVEDRSLDDNTNDTSQNSNETDVNVDVLNNVFVVAKDKVAGAILTDELLIDLDNYFTENGKAELQNYYVDENGVTRICTDVVTCNTTDNPFTISDVTFGDMLISSSDESNASVILQIVTSDENETVIFEDRYSISFVYDNFLWKIDSFSSI